MPNLIRLTKYGLYCPIGDFYIDATGRVDRNIVTHAHSDHARPGHKHYLTHHHSEPLMRVRLGKSISVQSMAYGESVSMNNVRVSFHPSGHIFGSAMVRVEYEGEIWVVSGDYKLEEDGVSEPFAPVSCHTFMSESTFGLPVYYWPDQDEEYRRINHWWQQNKTDGITSILFAYSLGKAQRLLKNIDSTIGPVYVHKTITDMNDVLRSYGINLPKTITIQASTTPDELSGNLIIAPPSFYSGNVARDLKMVSLGMASGWVQTGRHMGSGGADKGFILSDHADWDGLLSAIQATGAERVVTMHGYTAELSRWLNTTGFSSIEINDLLSNTYSGQ